ncbi:THO complex subunit 4D [Citrus sinensis]|nr:THO complex subunit 4D [Citrus sinensis]
MATHVDMSLDDIIKSRKKSERERGQGRARRGRGRGRGPSGSVSGGRMTGAARRGPLSNARPSSYTIAKASSKLSITRNFPWQHDLFEDSLRAAGISGIEVGTKLYVSNLHPGVTNDDIRVQLLLYILIINTVLRILNIFLWIWCETQELFSEIGELKRYAIHFDKNGRPSGSAEVVYARRSDAFAALKRYNNVLLDGKPMKIEVVGTNAEIPLQARVNVTGVNGRRKRTVVMTSGSGNAGGAAAINHGPGLWSVKLYLVCCDVPSQGRRGGLRRSSQGRGRGQGQGRGRGRGGGGGGGRGRGRGRGRGQGKKNPVDKSADDLDKELDNYHAEAMQI